MAFSEARSGLGESAGRRGSGSGMPSSFDSMENSTVTASSASRDRDMTAPGATSASPYVFIGREKEMEKEEIHEDNHLDGNGCAAGCIVGFAADDEGAEGERGPERGLTGWGVRRWRMRDRGEVGKQLAKTDLSGSRRVGMWNATQHVDFVNKWMRSGERR